VRIWRRLRHRVPGMDAEWGTLRVRATSYVTRLNGPVKELLVFRYLDESVSGLHLPGGGVEGDERPDVAAVREVVEETGIREDLALAGVVGVMQSRWESGRRYIDLFFHLRTEEPRDQWTHRMIGHPSAWDTGMVVEVRFEPLEEAARLLAATGQGQESFLHRIQSASDSVSSSCSSIP